MNKFGDFIQYLGMVAGIFILTRPRQRPPLYIDPDGTFHWTIHISYLPPPGAELIKNQASVFSDSVQKVIN